MDVVGEAGDGQAGVEVVREERPDVVLLDLAMPVMDGVEALPLIRELVPRRADHRALGVRGRGAASRCSSPAPTATWSRARRCASIVAYVDGKLGRVSPTAAGGTIASSCTDRHNGGMPTLDPAIAARLKRTADGLVAGDRAAARHRRGADARLDGRRGAGPDPDHRPGDVLEPEPAGVLGQGRDLGPPAVGPRGPAGLRRRHAAGARWTRRGRPATPATGPASTPTCCSSRASPSTVADPPAAPHLRAGRRGRARRRGLAAVAGPPAVGERHARPAASASCPATVEAGRVPGGQRAGAGGAGLLGRPAGHPGPGPPGGRGARRRWLALGLVATVVVGFGAAPRRRSATPTRARRRPTRTSSRTGWYWVAGVALPAHRADQPWPPYAWCPAGPRWAAGTTPRPTPRPPPSRRVGAAEEQENLDLWKAMDEGRDPTA